AQPGGERRLFLRRELRRDAETHDAGHVLRSGADPKLLAAAMNNRLDRFAVAHDQRADAFGSADLVAGDGEERAIDVAERDRDLAECLDGVRMEQDARVATSTGQ